MLANLNRNTEALNIRRWLRQVDLSDADILKTERDIYTAIIKSYRKRRWLARPIAPLAEPLNLDDLVGELTNGAREELVFQAGRIDNIYSTINDTNNLFKSELETVESLATRVSDSLRQIRLAAGDQNEQFYWITDSFNNTAYVDSAKTDALVDSDYGMVTLNPQGFESVNDFALNIDRQATKGFPGCNILVVNQVNVGNPNIEPSLSFESNNTSDIASIVDGDSSTWFEIERNFISPNQKMRMQGRAWVWSDAGQIKSVKEVTNDLDWKVYVQWPNTRELEKGVDSNGIPIAEFVDLNSESAVQRSPQFNTTKALNRTLAGENTDLAARLALVVVFATPQPISILKLAPFMRNGAGQPINVETIKVLTSDTWLDVVNNTTLGFNRSTTNITTQILRRTGVQSNGSLYSIPTDRDIQAIRIILSSFPEEVTKTGLGHRFKDSEYEERSDRRHLFWNSADTWTEWSRSAFFTSPPVIICRDSRAKVSGTLQDPITKEVAIDPFAPKVTADNKPFGGLSGVTQGAQQAAGIAQWLSQAAIASKIGGSIGSIAAGAANAAGFATAGGAAGIGGFLAGAVPILGEIALASYIVGNSFTYKHTKTLLQETTGFDIFKGWRAAVGLRDLAVQRITYAGTSTLISIKRSFIGPVSLVGLLVDETIPESWGSGDWITYFVSTDGDNWTPIRKLTEITLDKSFAPPAPITDIYFKALIKGNQSDPFHSPSLNHYVLQGVPA